MTSAYTPKVNLHEIRLGVACPMANEQDTVEAFCRQVAAQCRNFPFRSVQIFAVVDRVSTDKTLEILTRLATELPELSPVYAPENRCVVDAYMRGYRAALEAGCDWILEIDAGFSHNPAEIPRFVAAMSQGYEAVFGSRFGSGGKITDSSLVRELVSFGGSLLANALLDTTLTDMTSGFELFSRKALEAILATGIRSRGPFFQTEIRYHAHKFRITEVPISYQGASHLVSQGALRESFSQLWSLYLQNRAAWQG